MLLKDKVVIITGATSGIGRGCAEVFGREGAKVVITGRDLRRMEEVKKALDHQGTDHLGLIMDAGREDDNKRMVEEVIDKFGRIDILINNAG
ncbi:MAG TPA: SDR family NAD(P)-dependent oxidoreductase, partial [Cyclobacteriaceae bacterium]|nr:SDR family NAD(P)-dependent oxidoreductase [Cyclobacteriaceae bacterium]